jgi:hypothetical protein
MADAAYSPCIDAGDPNTTWGCELWPHGKLVNMGAYGGTTQASLSESDEGDIRDINNDNMVTLSDVSLLVDKWNSNIAPLKEDLNLDGKVNAKDLPFLNGNWQSDSNNIVPQFDIVSDVNVTTGNLISFVVSASDSDGDVLVYIAAGLPDGASFSGQTFTWTPDKEDAYQVTFIVSDNKSLSYMTILINVKSDD